MEDEPFCCVCATRCRVAFFDAFLITFFFVEKGRGDRLVRGGGGEMKVGVGVGAEYVTDRMPSQLQDMYPKFP